MALVKVELHSLVPKRSRTARGSNPQHPHREEIVAVKRGLDVTASSPRCTILPKRVNVKDVNRGWSAWFRRWSTRDVRVNTVREGGRSADGVIHDRHLCLKNEYEGAWSIISRASLWQNHWAAEFSWRPFWRRHQLTGRSRWTGEKQVLLAGRRTRTRWCVCVSLNSGVSFSMCSHGYFTQKKEENIFGKRTGGEM